MASAKHQLIFDPYQGTSETGAEPYTESDWLTLLYQPEGARPGKTPASRDVF